MTSYSQKNVKHMGEAIKYFLANSKQLCYIKTEFYTHIFTSFTSFEIQKNSIKY